MGKKMHAAKPRKNKYITIKISDEIRKEYPEIVKYITSLSPQRRGKLIVNTITLMGIAVKEPKIMDIITHIHTEQVIDKNTDKRKKETLSSKQFKVDEI